MRSSTRAWLLSVGFLVLGMGLMWWASAQWEVLATIMSSQFEVPAVRLLLWHLTVVVAGITFGLAVAASRGDSGQPRIQILGILSLIPLAGLFFFFSWILNWWAPTLPFSVNWFLFDESTRVAFALLLGFLLSGMIRLGKGAGPPTE